MLKSAQCLPGFEPLTVRPAGSGSGPVCSHLSSVFSKAVIRPILAVKKANRHCFRRSRIWRLKAAATYIAALTIAVNSALISLSHCLLGLRGHIHCLKHLRLLFSLIGRSDSRKLQ
ncbi:hypothetical protein NPIL_345861 [Nephila pilipes]|uniref:Uncharacterized protein n=1 Tax=Nephila pilipes TaxID=299642 RepID=A0A8X6NL66_NEPPI|nr:hypothetical protein NPIL_345861 [Nephila pilipes]